MEQQTSTNIEGRPSTATQPEPGPDDMRLDDNGPRAGTLDVASPPLLDVSWTDMDKEVDEYLAMDSDEEEDDEATPPTPPRATLKRVRSRSGTPSVDQNGDDDLTRSPLAKRKKLAADRPPSRLKKEILPNATSSSATALRVESSSDSSSQSDPDDVSDKNDTPSNPASEIGDEDDFLLRELQEAESGWG